VAPEGTGGGLQGRREAALADCPQVRRGLLRRARAQGALGEQRVGQGAAGIQGQGFAQPRTGLGEPVGQQRQVPEASGDPVFEPARPRRQLVVEFGVGEAGGGEELIRPLQVLEGGAQ
jgi:hypothetical protein